MKTYVLLLRGINVGGNNRVEMARLRVMLETMGFENVESYINSGNVIFDAKSAPSIDDIVDRINTEFGLTIPCIVLSGEAIIRIAKAIPEEWVNDSTERKSDVLYLFEKNDYPETVDSIGHNPEIESYLYEKGVIITTILRKHQSRSSLQKIVGTDLYKMMTVRNTTTARKLASIIDRRQKA